MAFTVMHLLGAVEPGGPDTDLDALLGELDVDDEEHSDVAVQHESGWSLTVLRSGRVVYENVETGGAVRTAALASRSETRRLLAALAAGQLATLDAVDWDADSSV